MTETVSELWWQPKKPATLIDSSPCKPNKEMHTPFSKGLCPGLKTISLLCFFSSVSSVARSRTSNPTSNPSISNFLIETLAFSEPQAVSISNRLRPTKTLEKPHSVVQYFKQLGFSDANIRSFVRDRPQVLFYNVDKTLKPKLQFFQDLGFTGPDLGKLISSHTHALIYSLDRTLIPCIDVIKKTLGNDYKHQDLFRILQRSHSISSLSISKLKTNIAFLESCGIVGFQLSMLLKTQPWLFFTSESHLRNQVSRVLGMGFSVDSRMLAHAVFVVGCMTGETFGRKIDLLRTFGFSEDECMEMFRRAPRFLGNSEAKLKSGMEFFLNDVKLERSVLLRRPMCLMYSMGERVIPRYHVLQVLKCKKLLKKEPSLLTVLDLTEEKFVEKFISGFRDDAGELLAAYKGNPDPSVKLEI